MNERRRQSRVQDRVGLTLRLVQPEAVVEYPPSAHFEMSDRQELLYSLAQPMPTSAIDSPELRAAVHHLDQKIGTLARLLAAEEPDPKHKQMMSVDLSDRGVGFNYPEPLTMGTTLALQLTLFPACIGLCTYARVIHCHRLPGANEPADYTIGTRFDGMAPEEVLLLNDHLRRHQRLTEAESIALRESGA